MANVGSTEPSRSERLAAAMNAFMDVDRELANSRSEVMLAEKRIAEATDALNEYRQRLHAVEKGWQQAVSELSSLIADGAPLGPSATVPPEEREYSKADIALPRVEGRW